MQRKYRYTHDEIFLCRWCDSTNLLIRITYTHVSLLEEAHHIDMRDRGKRTGSRKISNRRSFPAARGIFARSTARDRVKASTLITLSFAPLSRLRSLDRKVQFVATLSAHIYDMQEISVANANFELLLFVREKRYWLVRYIPLFQQLD